jgi:hypothetical protein
MVISPFPNRLNLLPAVDFAIRIGGEIDTAEIDAEIALRLIRSASDLRLRDAQIPDICPANQFRAADLPGRIVQVAALEITQNQLTDDATGQRVQAHTIQTHQAVGARIVADAASGGEGWAGFRNNLITISVAPFSFRAHRSDCFCRLVSCAAGQLCAQAIGDARLSVDQIVQLVLVRDSLRPRDRGAASAAAPTASLQQMVRMESGVLM